MRPPVETRPLAWPRPENGTHLLIRLALVGYAPAWLSPHPERQVSNAKNEPARPISPVNSDQLRMYRASIRRAPKRSLNQPEGTWPSAYVQKKALRNQLACSLLSWRSSTM